MLLLKCFCLVALLLERSALGPPEKRPLEKRLPEKCLPQSWVGLALPADVEAPLAPDSQFKRPTVSLQAVFGT